MKKGNNKMGVISWLINYKSLRDEYYDLLDTADKSKLDVENVKKETKRLKDVLEAEIENLNIDLERKQAKIKTLEDMITIKSNRILVLETTVKNRNEEIQGLRKELSDIVVKLDDLQSSFNKVRGEIGGLKKENNKLKSANEFLKTNRRSSNKEEILAYEYGQREVLRRNKEK